MMKINLKHIISTLILAVLVFSCKSKTKFAPYNSNSLKIEKINENLYKHISYLETEDYGKVACNGLIFFNSNKAIIFDTPLNNEVSKELIELIYKENEIVAIVTTHFHVDCLAGLNEFHSKNITSYANNLTIEFAKKNNYPLPQIGFDDKLELKVGKQKVVLQFFGEGHTKDNIVGYIPEENALFGGCLVKSVGANKGNTADANTVEWSNTINKIKQEFKNIKIVVPGHGETGGQDLLDYTAKLFQNK